MIGFVLIRIGGSTASIGAFGGSGGGDGASCLGCRTVAFGLPLPVTESTTLLIVLFFAIIRSFELQVCSIASEHSAQSLASCTSVFLHQCATDRISRQERWAASVPHGTTADRYLTVSVPFGTPPLSNCPIRDTTYHILSHTGQIAACQAVNLQTSSVFMG